MPMVTVKNLEITSWIRESADPPLQPGVQGIRLAGWWPRPEPSLEPMRELYRLWDKNATIKLELDILEDADERKHQVCAYVRIKNYPDGWLNLMSDSLALFVEGGAAVAWAGGWESMKRFNAASRFEACYAAFTRRTGFVCLSDLDEQIQTIDRRPDIVYESRS
jgi:hypothetical protein